MLSTFASLSSFAEHKTFYNLLEFIFCNHAGAISKCTSWFILVREMQFPTFTSTFLALLAHSISEWFTFLRLVQKTLFFCHTTATVPGSKRPTHFEMSRVCSKIKRCLQHQQPKGDGMVRQLQFHTLLVLHPRGLRLRSYFSSRNGITLIKT